MYVRRVYLGCLGGGGARGGLVGLVSGERAAPQQRVARPGGLSLGVVRILGEGGHHAQQH